MAGDASDGQNAAGDGQSEVSDDSRDRSEPTDPGEATGTSGEQEIGAGPDPRVAEGMFDGDGAGSALAHLYRGEIHRMRFWRERLDKTTNWSVLVMAAILTWAFSSDENPHYIILVGMAAISVFLVIESRRYRGYDIWRSRVRVLQENVFAYALDRDVGPVDPAWREKLSRDYVRPTMKLSFEEAVAHRLRRVYLPLFFLLLFAWLVRITAFSVDSWPESAAIGGIPGTAVSAVVATTTLFLLFVAARPRAWKGELHEADPDAWKRHREFREVSGLVYPIERFRDIRSESSGREPATPDRTAEDDPDQGPERRGQEGPREEE